MPIRLLVSPNWAVYKQMVSCCLRRCGSSLPRGLYPRLTDRATHASTIEHTSQFLNWIKNVMPEHDVFGLIIIYWVHYFTCHKVIRGLIEGTLAGIGAKVHHLATILSAGIFGWLCDAPAASGFEFRSFWFRHACHHPCSLEFHPKPRTQ